MGKIKNVNMIAILAIMLVAFMTVGYAYVSENSQNTSVNVQKSWSVGLNTDEFTSAGDGVDVTAPIISKNNIKLEVSFSKPGQYKTYTFEVLNTGDINAILDNVKLISDSSNSSDLNFSYTIYKGQNIITSDIVPTIDEQYNHLYRTYGTNIVEITIMYNGQDVEEDEVVENYFEEETYETVIAKYELALTYTQAE